MPHRTRPNIFPLSISSYGILYIVLSFILFGGFGWMAVNELYILQNETNQKNLELAKKELEESITEVFNESEKLAKLFSNWDETIQQLGNSTYYSYWREYRVPSASFVPTYLSAVELYDRNGMALESPKDEDMPVEIPQSNNNLLVVKQRNKDNLYYTYPVAYDFKSKHVGGFIVIKIDFISALTALQRFKYVELDSLSLDVEEGVSIDRGSVLDRFNIEVIPNKEFNQLQFLMFDTLQRFALIAVSMALLLFYLFIKVFGLPSRRLSQQIDMLRHGGNEAAQEFDEVGLAVAEFEKVRLSLNDYQKQLDSRDAALRDNEMRMRSVLDNVVDGIITIDDHGIIESCNPAVARVFALGDYDVIGLNITTLFAESSLNDYYTYGGQCFQRSINYQIPNDVCELIGTRRDKSEFPIEIVLSKMQVAGKRLFIVVVRDITERKRAEEKLVYLANYDELTGLPNRTLFRDRLSQAVSHAKRENRLVAVVFFDLDQFKKINDTLGHHAGDQLLIGASRRLKHYVREMDTVARLGGDEFMVILESIHNAGEITDIVSKLLEAMAKPFMIDGQEAFVAASAGIAIYPVDDSSIDDLVKNADTAMFRAKEQGGNTYQYFQAEMNIKAVERLRMESALRYALEREEFEIHYQPRVDIKTGNITGMEALLRWHNDQIGMISPVKFIPVLEETGLIVQVGEWVLKTACAQARIWHDAGYPLRVAVNLSVRQFRQQDLVKKFAAIWESARFDPHYLELEITESLLVENMDTAAVILDEFHNIGVHISIDDFGTGYSSLSYLKRFPIDTLKIDRSFVRDIIDDPDDAAITEAIVALARSLRMTVTAEGIENKAQLEFLRTLQCDEAQGIYFSKPLSALDFEQCIVQRSCSFNENTYPSNKLRSPNFR